MSCMWGIHGDDMVDVLELRNDEAVFVALMFLEIDSLLVSFGYPFFSLYV